MLSMCIHVSVCASMSLCVRLCVYARLCVSLCASLCISVCVYLCVPCACTRLWVCVCVGVGRHTHELLLRRTPESLGIWLWVRRAKLPAENSVGVLTPGTSHCDLIWRWRLSKGNPLKKRSLAWALTHYDCVLIKRENLGTETDKHGGETHAPTSKAELRRPEARTPGAHSSSRGRRDRPCHACMSHLWSAEL